MELEFDKEMDAILRRARDNRGVLVGDDPPAKPKHIDADSIAAFVENALPAKTRTLVMEHFADCDRCRRVLSRSMLLASEANGADVTAASIVSAPAVSAAMPWYQKLFRTPNLAMAMGSLVLVFGGLLGYMVIQNRQSDSNASVARIKDGEQQAGGLFASEEPSNTAASSANANAAPMANAANLAIPAADTIANDMATPRLPSANKPALPGGRPDLSVSGGAPADSGVLADEDKARDEPRVAKAAPPPAPAMLDGLASERESKKEIDDKLKSKDDRADPTMMRKQAEAPRGRDLPAPASKSGPARSGPINMQSNQNQNQTSEMLVTRSVSGKTFSNRNGAWYDSAYKNQATMNFRRGTDEYKKLDGGLRNIADTLGGTVVLVWKSKAYRIQ